MTSEIESHGYAIARDVANEDQRKAFVDLLGPVDGAGRRGLLGMPEVVAWARSEPVMRIIRPHLPVEPIAVRGIYFDKSSAANWLVPWHQDLTIALHSRADVAAFGPWSVKEGIPHAQPPVELLKRMLTLRLHLDDADAGNGALRILPGSHRYGRLSSGQIQQLRAEVSEILCPVAAGDAMLMRPLLLHASGRATDERHRRVVHIEYAAFELPPPLQWHEAA